MNEWISVPEGDRNVSLTGSNHAMHIHKRHGNCFGGDWTLLSKILFGKLLWVRVGATGKVKKNHHLWSKKQNKKKNLIGAHYRAFGSDWTLLWTLFAKLPYVDATGKSKCIFLKPLGAVAWGGKSCIRVRSCRLPTSGLERLELRETRQTTSKLYNFSALDWISSRGRWPFALGGRCRSRSRSGLYNVQLEKAIALKLR